MSEPRWTNIEAIFTRAVQIERAGREAFLSQACGDDVELLAEVRELLEAHMELGDFLDSPVRVVALANDAAPSVIGPYSIIEQIGQGGMGSVYRARQSGELERDVALKVVQGVDSPRMLARFQQERRTLGRMAHPSIAQVFDAGRDERGHAYFTMELVDGEPIDVFCDSKRLGLRARIELLVQVAEGLHHAHQKGVLHRDIKPTNILVSDADGTTRAKIIDFGIATALDDQLKAHHTQTGALIGTPRYMSPEQIEQRDDIDTRSDVYALGLVAYELLVGAPPFDVESGLANLIYSRDREATRPTTRLRLLGDALESVARKRGLAVDALMRHLGGDLEVVILKAIRRERETRYGSVSEFSADLIRVLNHEPIAARPASTLYVLRKLVQRHKVGSGLAVLALVALVAGVLGTSIGFVRAERAREEAVAQGGLAQRSAEKAQAVNAFLVGMLSASAPQSENKDLSVREMLDRAAERAFENESGEVSAAIHHTLGVSYMWLGHYERAEKHLRQALRERQKHLGPDHVETLDSMSQLVLLLTYQSRFDEARSLADQAYTRLKALVPDDDPRLIRAMQNRGDLYLYLNQDEVAADMYAQSLRAVGKDEWTVRIMTNYGRILQKRGDYEQAESIYRQARSSIESRGVEDHPNYVAILAILGGLNLEQGDLDGARANYQRAVEFARDVYGPDHPDLIKIRNGLASVLREQGDHDAALKMARENYARCVDQFGPDHYGSFITGRTLGQCLRAAGQYGEASDHLKKLSAGALEALGPIKLGGQILQELGEVYVDDGQWRSAAEIFSRAVDLGQEIGERDLRNRALEWQASCLLELGDIDRANSVLTDIDPDTVDASEFAEQVRALRQRLQ